LIRLTLILSGPLFLVIVVGFFLMPYRIGYIKEVLAFGFLTTIVIGVNILITNQKIRKWFVLFCAVLLSVFAFIKLSFYANYGTKLSASALYVIFETNTDEASDFLLNYFSKTVYVILLMFMFFISGVILFLNKVSLNIENTIFYKGLAICSIISSIFCIHWRLSSENMVLMGVTSYKHYLKTKNNLKASLAQYESNAFTTICGSNMDQTYVIIIGESTSRWHMQLYDYDRETNPKLTEIEDELVIFDDVITPNVHTILALDKILTLSDFSAPSKKNNGSIVQLANSAGFETFWISNQKPVGLHESIPTLIGSAAKNKDFLNTDDFAYDIYDEKLLPKIVETLNRDEKKKIIFVHLIGTHTAYKKRYPKAFNFFKTKKEGIEFSHKKAIRLTNEYDNAVRYNDFIIREIIEKVRAARTNSYVLYFSDHGDEIYDTMDLVGHNEYHGTKPMYDVPFIVWLSKDFKSSNPELFEIPKLNKRPYILEDFIHSFSDLSNIEFSGIDYKKSIFNSTFSPKKRVIRKNEDYDEKK